MMYLGRKAVVDSMVTNITSSKRVKFILGCDVNLSIYNDLALSLVFALQRNITRDGDAS